MMRGALAALLALALVAPAAASAQSTGTRKAPMGRAVTLHGFERERMLVRPFRVVRLAPAEFETRQLVAVSVSMKNTGRTTYSDSPSNGAQLVTRGGKTIDSTFVSDDTGCDGGAHLRVPRGQKRITCIAFEVPAGTRLRYFEFSLNSGLADELGQWRGLPAL